MAVADDLKILYQMVLAPVRGDTHAQRLESFYRPQAAGYDAFRRRLLFGRRELMAELAFSPGEVWVDMGAGTGANLDHIAPRVPALERVYLVDLSESLRAVAKQRIAAHGWRHVTTENADVRGFQPEQPVDVVTFSYSLTMIPDWVQALEHAKSLLKPGGRIGVVDFYVSRKYPATGRRVHAWWQRHFWRAWFERDNVFLSPDHLPFLADRFQTQRIFESMASMPFLPFLRAPYYRFIGKTASAAP